MFSAGSLDGMPTKTEQGDLLLAHVRPPWRIAFAIIAACSPSDCFDAAIER